MSTAWDELHTQPRHQTRYPSEHAVRFLAGIDPPNRNAVDIGCGSGRHSRLLAEQGYAVSACDSSHEAVARTRSIVVDVQQASMTALPFPTDTFGVAIAFGVFYYGTEIDHELAVAELHRVLAPGGSALVVHRTTEDSRTRYGNPLSLPDHPEDGMTMNFLTEDDITRVYAPFSSLRYELTETTRLDGTWTDSDWLITVTK